jgi:hypothetical protein
MMLRVFIFLFILCCWIAGNLPVFAAGIDQIFQNQQPNKEWTTKFGNLFSNAKSYAIVVSISEYIGEQNYGYPRLETSRSDSEKMRRFLLEDAGFDYVHVLTEEKVTKVRLNELMIDIFPTMVTPKDRFLFYWSGHGDQRNLEGINRAFGYLPLHNSRKRQFSSMINMDDISNWDRLIPARHTLFVLDACLSGLAGIQEKSDAKSLSIEQLSRPARHLITAGTATEKVITGDRWKGSLFTEAFIEGAKGDAGSKMFSDGIIGLSDLISYVRRRVNFERQSIGWEKTLTPQLNKLQFSEGEFFFSVPMFASHIELKQNPWTTTSSQPKGATSEITSAPERPSEAPVVLRRNFQLPPDSRAQGVNLARNFQLSQSRAQETEVVVNWCAKKRKAIRSAELVASYIKSLASFREVDVRKTSLGYAEYEIVFSEKTRDIAIQLADFIEYSINPKKISKFEIFDQENRYNNRIDLLICVD